MMHLPRPIFVLLCIAFCLLVGVTIFIETTPDITQPTSTLIPTVSQARHGGDPINTHADSTPAQLADAQANVDRLRQERDELLRSNAALEEARSAAEKAKTSAEKESEFYGKVAAKLLDGDLKKTQTIAEGAVSVGQWNAKVAQLKKKWGDRVPREGTPEAVEYQRDQDELITGVATMAKFMGDKTTIAEITKAENIAQFQSLSIYGALGLSEDQWRGINATLAEYYRNGYARGLNAQAKPQAGSEAWDQLRTELSQRAFADVKSRLTPAQAAEFQNIYGGNDWLWQIAIEH